MDFIDRILAKWRTGGVRLNDGATPGQIAQLESLLGVALPEDIRHFYECANGMAEDTYDPCHLSFWSIEQVARDAVAYPRKPTSGIREIAFADFLLDSHFYVYRVPASGHLRLGHDLDITDEFSTLDNLFQRYLENAERMPVLIDSEWLGKQL